MGNIKKWASLISSSRSEPSAKDRQIDGKPLKQS